MKVRGQRSNYIYVSEDYIDIFMKKHWPKFNRVTNMIKYGRKKRIRKKYINIYEKERKFIIKLLKTIR